MSKPTILSPWYVVTRFQTLAMLGQQEWYIAQDDPETPAWAEDQKQAMLFQSLHSAHRVARAEGAYVVVVVDETDMKEYRNA